MNKSLWIDDIRNPPDDSYDIARTYDDAIRMLSTHQYEEVYFDHDLADFKDGKERTGYDVAVWLAERKHADGLYIPQRYFLLTANPTGRQRIQGVIDRYLIS